MAPLRQRAILLAAAVSVFALAVSAAALSGPSSARPDVERTSFHQVIADHDAVVSVRAAAERSALDLRQVHSKLLLLAWFGVLLVAALLARTAGRTIEPRTHRSGSVAAARPRSNRGPPQVSFA